MRECAHTGCQAQIHEEFIFCPAHNYIPFVDAEQIMASVQPPSFIQGSEEQLLEFMGGDREGTKATNPNPKDVIGSTKMPLHLCMGPARIYWCLGQVEGMLKYGKVNWRTVGVRVSIYLDAMERHMVKFAEGQWADPVTRVPHLGSVMACSGIIIDAHEAGNLVDDRPRPMPGFDDLLDRWGPEMIAHLKGLYASHDPHHHTIRDLHPDAPEGCCVT